MSDHVVGPAGGVEHDILRLLASGHLDALTGPGVSLGPDPTFARLAGLDVAVRAGDAGLHELAAVRRQLEAEPVVAEWHRWWLAAITADHMVFDADIEAAAAAVAVLADVPVDPLCDPEILYPRGRLRRAASIVRLAGTGTDDVTASRDLRDLAIVDLQRCGFLGEVAVTRAVWAFSVATMRLEDPHENLVRIRDARAELTRLGESTWTVLVDLLLASVAYLVGDFGEAAAAFDRVDAAEAAGTGRRPYPQLGPFLRAAWGTVTGGTADTIVADVDAAIDAARGDHPRLVRLLQAHAAHLLIDLGHPEARRFVLCAGDSPPRNPMERLDNELLRLRLDLAEGAVPAAAELKHLAQQIETAGRPRHAGLMALRLARDLEARGLWNDADALRTWGLERVPPAPRRTVWEQLWACPVAPPGDEVRVAVLCPALEVTRSGRRLEVRETVAKLLVALVAAHPQPLHVEQAIELLWPDTAVEVGRRRLNTVVHRVRGVLATDKGDDGAVRRTGDLLWFEPGSVRVDLLEHRTALESDDDRRQAAVLAIRGNLCHAQFPYDDVFIAARREVATAWRDAARQLVAAGRLTTARVEAVAPLLATD